MFGPKLHGKLNTLIVSVAMLLALSWSTLPSVSGGAAQEASRLFPETGKSVKGKFLAYWNNHGELAQQGYPISGEIQEVSDTDGKTYTVQYFERAVFEMHPEFQPPNDVLLSLLGAFHYKQKYPNGAPNQKPSADNPYKFDKPGETGKTIGGKFRAYWEKFGALPQQGYPISEEFEEKSELNGQTYTVQYFQRALFEYHPENAGTQYEVLLAQLGAFRHKIKTSPPTATAVSTATAVNTPIVVSTPTLQLVPTTVPTAVADCFGLPGSDPRVTITPNCGTGGTIMSITVNGLVPRYEFYTYLTRPDGTEVPYHQCWRMRAEAYGGEAHCDYTIDRLDRSGVWKLEATVEEVDYTSYFKVWGTSGQAGDFGALTEGDEGLQTLLTIPFAPRFR